MEIPNLKMLQVAGAVEGISNEMEQTLLDRGVLIEWLSSIKSKKYWKNTPLVGMALDECI